MRSTYLYLWLSALVLGGLGLSLVSWPLRAEPGQRPDPAAEDDAELKLYALNGLAAADSKRALPLVLERWTARTR